MLIRRGCLAMLLVASAASCRLGPEDDPLNAFSRRCDAQGVERLLREGRDPNDADEFGDLAIVSAVVGEAAGPDGDGCAETVQILFREGATVQTLYRDESLFFIAAAYSDSPAVVVALMDAGVDPCVGPGEEWTTSFAARDLVSLAQETGRPSGVVDAFRDLPSC